MERQPSPARHKSSSVVHIRNLVRPFTVNQLKELLARTGTITDFWIDNIKSKCYCQVSGPRWGVFFGGGTAAGWVEMSGWDCGSEW